MNFNISLEQVIGFLFVGLIAIVFWFLRKSMDYIKEQFDRKVDIGCHDQCNKAKEEMNKLLLDEIRGLRSDFKDKSAIVIDAVKPRKRKR